MLPKPSDSFEWRQLPAGPALVCRPLEAVARHFFTTRRWTLGSQPAVNQADAWNTVAEAAHVAAADLRRLKQVHRADVVIAGSGTGDPLPAADIILSTDPDLAVAVQAADCVPLLIADARTGAVAAAHAGWRGLAARVPHVAVQALKDRFGSDPDDLIAAVGPSIGSCCYEVGEEVRTEFARAFAATESAVWFSKVPVAINGNPPFRELTARPGRWFFDGWQAAWDQLASAGVPPGRIHVARLCTASHPRVFCSYRRDNGSAGRLAAVIRPLAR